MTITKIFSYISAIAMTVVIFWAQSQVPIFESPIPDLPWGTVSLVDLYTGFIFVCFWIFYKENVLPAIVWTFFVMTLGSFTIALYVIYSINKSDGNIQKFFMGDNS